jgi:hypothetical protein
MGLNQTGLPVDCGAAGENRPLAWGPVGDHTLCAVVNELRVCERLARSHLRRTLVVNRGNVLRRFTGGQAV